MVKLILVQEKSIVIFILFSSIFSRSVVITVILGFPFNLPILDHPEYDLTIFEKCLCACVCVAQIL